MELLSREGEGREPWSGWEAEGVAQVGKDAAFPGKGLKVSREQRAQAMQ